jgi:hypothetical protein
VNHTGRKKVEKGGKYQAGDRREHATEIMYTLWQQTHAVTKTETKGMQRFGTGRRHKGGGGDGVVHRLGAG